MMELRPSTWPALGLVLVGLFIYLIWTELLSQDCTSRSCYNATPIPTTLDTPRQIIDKMVTTLRVNHSPVEWRKGLMIGLVVTLIIGFGLCLPNPIVVVLIIFIVVYFVATWTNWTRWRCLDVRLEQDLLRLRGRV